MTTSDDRDNTYILGHTPAEMTRLVEQGLHFTKGMGGLLAEQSDLARFSSVLDIACGPGEWALELAQTYAHMEVVAIDIDVGMIEYARTMARASGLENVSFQVMNALEPLAFPDNSFDLVNARFLGGFMPATAWPAAIGEFVRVARRGGTIRLTDSEWGSSNSAAFEQAYLTIIRAMQATGQGLCPGRHYGTTPWLSRFLRDAGCIHIQEKPYAIEFSTGTEAHPGLYQDYTLAFKLMQPFEVGVGVISQHEADRLFQQVQLEMMQDDFCAVTFLLTAWGEKS